jgi:hypothetical protein
MKSIGFNISKERLSYCILEGTKSSCKLAFRAYEKFDAGQPLPEMMNYFRQTFSELLSRHEPDIIAYRMSLEGKKASIPYLCFSYGILNLLSYEQEIPIVQTISATFSKKQLGREGDKFEVCDEIIDDIPSEKWNNEYRYAALAARSGLDA